MPRTPLASLKPRGTRTSLRRRAGQILARLYKAYPQARCSLRFTNPLELLVATILSAQCTDERVNQITPALFQQFPAAQDYANAPRPALEEAIRLAGLYRHKARHIQETCAILVNRFQGQVPRTMEELLELPGVGRKTANVILGNAFGLCSGVAVDTHTRRVANRLGLTASDDPLKIEQDMMGLLPRTEWTQITQCAARAPRCSGCPLLDLCPYPRGRSRR
ncbi:MAG: endonuclease III [Candidatus Tectomicrobia bacterium]|uniref:Endonuclease III n=1 Tax=Tectimicrobiota bacterium TaxID=2528274 RepID=A0A932GMI8_UNCTE|nr:endonuclease III [Candidatus Tectomicrobia bacterium]